ncbi:hypothetical protein RRG08_026842 [Elysia crispata]|uniref:Uncharacterized protein n=1 Tax=Elysia crispata TaxID=231223 RepID=A0AAE0Y702_9GAST|nr:hypothetical protein RRG08_026842 [Elysia crispata]
MNSTRKIRAELSVSIAPSQPLYDYLTPVRLQDSNSQGSGVTSPAYSAYPPEPQSHSYPYLPAKTPVVNGTSSAAYDCR